MKADRRVLEDYFPFVVGRVGSCEVPYKAFINPPPGNMEVSLGEGVRESCNNL